MREVTSHRAASAAHTTVASHTLSVLRLRSCHTGEKRGERGRGGGIIVKGHHTERHQLHTPPPLIHLRSCHTGEGSWLLLLVVVVVGGGGGQRG